MVTSQTWNFFAFVIRSFDQLVQDSIGFGVEPGEKVWTLPKKGLGANAVAPTPIFCLYYWKGRGDF